MKTFTKENIAKERNKSGLYRFFNQKGRLIYIGTSRVMKHRLQSYYQEDDFNEHPTKRRLRDHIRFYSVEYGSLSNKRIIEHKIIHNKELEHNWN